MSAVRVVRAVCTETETDSECGVRGLHEVARLTGRWRYSLAQEHAEHKLTDAQTKLHRLSASSTPDQQPCVAAAHLGVGIATEELDIAKLQVPTLLAV